MTEYKVFIDTNIWIYAFIEKNEKKRKYILNFIEETSLNKSIIVSTQVINEFHYVCLRKYSLDENEIFSLVGGIKTISIVLPLDFDIYEQAFYLRRKYNLSFWDSLIISSALKSKCKILYSEDMQHNLKIENLKIKNPFRLD